MAIRGTTLEFSSYFQLPLRLKLPVDLPLHLVVVVLVSRASLELTLREHLVILVSNLFRFFSDSSGLKVIDLRGVPLKFPTYFQFSFRSELLFLFSQGPDIGVTV